MNKFYVKAIGWSIEVTGQFLTKSEVEFLKKSKDSYDLEFGTMAGSLDGILEGYNCYHTNGWQTGTLPLFDLNRFFVFDETFRNSFALTKPLISNSDTSFFHDRSADMFFKLKARNNRLLVYFEEFKGVSAAWELLSNEMPKARDFKLCYGKFKISKKSFTFLTGVEYRGVSLERSYDLEISSSKSSYSRLY